MTRGRESNRAYVILDRADDHAAGAVCRVNSVDSPGRWVARSVMSSSTSAAEVTRRAWPVRSSSCAPRLVTGPGTAPTWRPSWWASDATRSAPDRAPASTTTVAADIASKQSGAG